MYKLSVMTNPLDFLPSLCTVIFLHHCLKRAKKLYAPRFYRLKPRHGAIGIFPERRRVAKSAEFWWYGDREKSVMDLYIHKPSKVKDAMPNFEETFGQNRNSMVETIRKKMVSRVLSKQASSRTIIGMFERQRSG